jgi:hypothetical protein
LARVAMSSPKIWMAMSDRTPAISSFILISIGCENS